MSELAGQRVTVAGLGHFGGNVAAARWLVSQGAKVLVTDVQPAEKLADALPKLAGLDITYRLGGHVAADFTACDLVVASPAIAPSNEYLSAARDAGVPVTSEIVLTASRLRAQRVLGVTGTKGKSTATTLLGRMLNVLRSTERASQIPAEDLRVYVGGNVGAPLIETLEQIREQDVVVLELSSYMLHYLGQMQWRPHVSVVTMISEDHLSWHGGAEAYVDDKRNLVRYQRGSDHAVLPAFDAPGREFAKHTAAKVHEYGKRANLPAAFAPRLPGKHNRMNERAAFTAAKIFGVYPDEAASACEDFAGLPHRMQLVHEAAGVRWVNDSIATVPEAAIAGLTSFAAGTVIQIVGGSDKGLNVTGMAEALRSRAKATLCIGQTGAAMAEMIGIGAENCQTLPQAVARAKALAAEGDIVLLSPGFASYGQFMHFEERGDTFARLARE